MINIRSNIFPVMRQRLKTSPVRKLTFESEQLLDVSDIENCCELGLSEHRWNNDNIAKLFTH